jgi:hypothetical protein
MGKMDSVAMNLKPTFSLDKYAGKYINEVYGNSWIKVEGNTLILKFEHHPLLWGKLESLGGDRFLCTYNDPTFGVKVIPFRGPGSEVESFN